MRLPPDAVDVATRRARPRFARGSRLSIPKRGSAPLFRRLLFVALLLEAGLLLILIPWSTFWERNYFAEALPGLDAFLDNPFVRGAVSGLGLVNVLAALAELVDLFGARGSAEPQLPEEPGRLGDRHAP